jgi:hypothetical protein
MNASKLYQSQPRRVANACVTSCRKLIAQIQRIKQSVLGQFRDTVGAHEHLLRLALNEAEALARQTPYPHLFFPMLALEKAQSVQQWHDRQQSLQGSYSALTATGHSSHSPLVH